VIAADLLTLLLVVGVVVLIISTTTMALNFTPSARRRRRSSHPLSPSAAHTLALAQARAATHAAEQTTVGAASGARRPTSFVTGQIIDISDDPIQGREMTVEYAQALAEHVAETDPQFVAEVISQWIRADSTDEADLFR
jgi:flagellar biosynthesis/type III secretory pathway M-ring protein FliF/YscJ